MSENLYNGAVVPTNGDSYDLTADLRKLALSLNVPIPVVNQGQRDGLAALNGGSIPVGTVVYRRDQSMLQETWDGAAWRTGAPHIEWFRDSQIVPSATVWGTGTMSLDATRTTDSAFVTHPDIDQLRFRDAGVYSITFTAKAEANMTGRSFVQIQTNYGVALIRTVLTGEDRGAAVIPNFMAAAGEVLTFAAYHSSGANRTLDFRIRVTRVG